MRRLSSFVLLCALLLPARALADRGDFPQVEFLTGAVLAGGSSDYGYGIAKRRGYGGYLSVRFAAAFDMFVPMFTIDVAGGYQHASFAETTNVLMTYRIEGGLGLKLDVGMPLTLIAGGHWGSDSTFIEFAGVNANLDWVGLYGRARTTLKGVAVELGVSEGHPQLRLVQLLAGVRLPLGSGGDGGLVWGAEVRHTFSLTSQTGGTWAGLLFGRGL